MAMEITNNYSAYEDVYAAQKQQTEKRQAASGKETSETVENGEIYLDGDDMQKVIEAAREQKIEQAGKKQGNYANAVGANLDFQI